MPTSRRATLSRDGALSNRECTKMVRQECANFSRGTCLFTHAGECPVMQGKRCPVSSAVLSGGNPNTPGIDYFSTCVAPLAKNRPEYIEAANEYARITENRKVMVTIRSCACGAALAKGKQCCSTCKRKRSREAKRKWWTATRSKLPKSSA